MHCDSKIFRYFGEKKYPICFVKVSASVYGTTMTLHFPSDKKEEIVTSLSKAFIPLKPGDLTSISISTSLFATAKIKKSLEILSSEGLINQDFAQEIATNYPDGFGGKMDLNNQRWAFGQTQVAQARTYRQQYDDALQKERTGLFRHAYRENFFIETDYEPNKEPVYANPEQTHVSANSQVLEKTGLFRHVEPFCLKERPGPNTESLPIDLGKTDNASTLEKTGLFRHIYRERFSVDANYEPNVEPKLV